MGQPYGLTYDIVDRKLKTVPPRAIQEVGMGNQLVFQSFFSQSTCSLEDTDATNELINDGDIVQPLALQEIEELKKSGTHVSVRVLHV